MISLTKDERYDMSGAIRYIKFSGDYNKFGECKKKTEAIFRHEGILKCLTKELAIPIEDESDKDEEKLISLKGTPNHWIYLSST